MKNEVLNDIKKYAARKLQEHYGICGVAECDEMAIINSDDKGGNNITIKIETKPE
jgi:hypothetical protein